jgi:hypothetical protein
MATKSSATPSARAGTGTPKPSLYDRGDPLPNYAEIKSADFDRTYKGSLVWKKKAGDGSEWVLARIKSKNGGSGQLNLVHPETGDKLGSPNCSTCFHAVSRTGGTTPYKVNLGGPNKDSWTIQDDESDRDEMEPTKPRSPRRKLDFEEDKNIQIITSTFLVALLKVPMPQRRVFIEKLIPLLHQLSEPAAGETITVKTE